MRKAALFVVVLVGTMAVSLAVGEAFGLSLRTTGLLALGGALFCLSALVVTPRLRRRLAYSRYREQAFLDQDLIVSKSWYRGNRVLHYCDGSVAALTQRGLRNFESFDQLRSFVDGR